MLEVADLQRSAALPGLGDFWRGWCVVCHSKVMVAGGLRRSGFLSMCEHFAVSNWESSCCPAPEVTCFTQGRGTANTVRCFSVEHELPKATCKVPKDALSCIIGTCLKKGNEAGEGSREKVL